jgi:hypothetical protein
MKKTYLKLEPKDELERIEKIFANPDDNPKDSEGVICGMSGGCSAETCFLKKVCDKKFGRIRPYLKERIKTLKKKIKKAEAPKTSSILIDIEVSGLEEKSDSSVEVVTAPDTFGMFWGGNMKGYAVGWYDSYNKDIGRHLMKSSKYAKVTVCYYDHFVELAEPSAWDIIFNYQTKPKTPKRFVKSKNDLLKLFIENGWTCNSYDFTFSHKDLGFFVEAMFAFCGKEVKKNGDTNYRIAQDGLDKGYSFIKEWTEERLE